MSHAAPTTRRRLRERPVVAFLTALVLIAATFTGLSVGPFTSIASATDGDMTLTVTTTFVAQQVEMPIAGTVTGTVTIDWGDSSSSSVTTDGNVPHVYGSPGTYTVSIAGSFTHFGSCGFGSLVGVETFTAVTAWGNNGTNDFSCAFFNATSLVSVPAALPTTTPIVTTSAMFYGASSFNSNIGGWDTSSIVDMSYMFNGAASFNQDISGWNTSNVTDMSVMFADAISFNRSLQSWNTANVINMYRMFAAASAFNQNLGNWNIANVLTMDGMLDGSGLSKSNYSNTLIGWATLPPPSNIVLGADGLVYDQTAVAARATLTSTYTWTISGDTFSPSPGPSTSTTSSSPDPGDVVIPQFAG